MIVIGTVGGRVGGSVIQRSMDMSYARGKMFGEAKHDTQEFGEKLAQSSKRKRKRTTRFGII